MNNPDSFLDLMLQDLFRLLANCFLIFCTDLSVLMLPTLFKDPYKSRHRAKIIQLFNCFPFYCFTFMSEIYNERVASLNDKNAPFSYVVNVIFIIGDIRILAPQQYYIILTANITQEGRRHWAVYYTSPRSLTITFNNDFY